MTSEDPESITDKEQDRRNPNERRKPNNRRKPGIKGLQYILLGLTAVVMVVMFFQTQLMDFDRYTAESQSILKLKGLDILLEKEALKASSLQLSNYDNFVTIESNIKSLTDRLKDPNGPIYGSISHQMDGFIDDYMRSMNTKLDLIESLKSQMSIVRNTLNFLPTEVDRVSSHNHREIDLEYHRLLTALLAQNISPSPLNVKKFDASVQNLSVFLAHLNSTSSDAKNIARILRHSRANMKATANTNLYFLKLMDLPTNASIERILSAHAEHALQRIRTADTFRNVLLALSLLLFISFAITLFNLSKARQHSLRSSQRFKDAVESISEGFAFFDHDGKLQFWNKTFARLHETCGDALKSGTSFHDFFQACTDTHTYLDMHAATNDNASEAHHNNHSYTIKGQGDMWMLASDSPMGDGGTACVRVDITENKRAEAEMRKLSRAVEQSPASVIITDLAGVIVYVNPKFTETTGYEAREAIGQKPSLVSSGTRSSADYTNLWETISADQEWHGEFHNKRKDGSFYWENASISAIKNERGEITHYLGIKEDITEQKKNLSELVQAKESAELANQSKTQFLANMSHELRTPLNAIIGFSEILKEEMFGPIGNKQYLEYTDNIFDSGQHLLSVINDILDVSRIEIGALDLHEDTINLNTMCQACVNMVQEQANVAKVSLNLNLAENLPFIHGDEIRLKQTIVNLLSNAIKFSTAGERVAVNVFSNDKSGVSFEVCDTGIGISKDQHDNILEPFEQVGDIFNRSHEGSGLGLFFVKSFVDLHAGTFDIESKLGEGSTFRFSLPQERVMNNE